MEQITIEKKKQKYNLHNFFFKRKIRYFIKKISIEVIEMYGSSDAARVTEKVLGQLLWNPQKDRSLRASVSQGSNQNTTALRQNAGVAVENHKDFVLP